MFTYFTDRDGKYQLGTLKESAFDPLSRTCEFMLKEEAHHMFVGTTGMDRVVERTAQLMVEHDTDDVAGYGAIPLDVIQKYLNFHYSVSLDLFGGETSTNVANYYTAGLKGRWLEDRRKDDHQLTDDVDHGRRASTTATIGQTEVSALVGLNTDLRREYIADCQSGVNRWNRILDEAGLPHRLRLPHVAFNRKVGAFAGIEATPDGELLRGGVGAAQGPVAADRRGQDPRAVADAAGPRTRQDRRLDRAAAQRDQRQAVRLRVPTTAAAEGDGWGSQREEAVDDDGTRGADGPSC